MNVETKLDQLDLLLEEKKFHLEVLRLWNAAKDAGYKPEYVKTFTFSDAFLSQEARDVNIDRLNKNMNPLLSGATHHNAVRLVSGDLAEIPLMDRPLVPKHMRVTVEDVE